MKAAMKIRFAAFAVLCVAIAFLNPVTVMAEDISRAFLCEKIDGFIIAAPDRSLSRTGTRTQKSCFHTNQETCFHR